MGAKQDEPGTGMKPLKAFAVFLVVLIWGILAETFAQRVRDEIVALERPRLLRLAQAGFDRSLDTSFDATYYRLALKVDPARRRLTGAVTTEARARVADLRQVELDFLNNMTVDSVRSGGQALDFAHTNDRLRITLPRAFQPEESFTFTVYYHGNPQGGSGLASFNFDSHGSDNAPLIWTLSEPFGARAWWPCQDHPADKADSVDVIVTVPDTLVVASNGKLVSTTDHGDGTRTFFWAERYPITTYLVSLAITNYVTFSDFYAYAPDSVMEVQFFVYPEDLKAAQEDFSVTVPMLEAFSQLFGPYPFLREKYGMAEFGWGGAMEHQTCTSYGAQLIRGDHWYDWVVAHELAHQWFGDLVTMRAWSHIWLNEGFASYAEALWAEHLGGPEAYHDYVASFDRGLFPTSVFVYDSTNNGSLFSRTVYDKGALVLHMLRHVLKDEAFFAALKAYAVEFAYSNATTEDFRRVCERAYGADLNWFFQQWVYGRYRPFYEYSWYDSTALDRHVVVLQLDQIQDNTGLFTMPLDVRISTAAGADTTFVVWDSLASQTFYFDLAEAATNLEIDPDGWVLKFLQEKPTSVASASEPRSFHLEQNYPNPFNAETVLAYSTPGKAVVTLEIYDLLGRRVRRWVQSVSAPGSYTVRWDGHDGSGRPVTSGIYFYRLRAGDFVQTRKLAVVR